MTLPGLLLERCSRAARALTAALLLTACGDAATPLDPAQDPGVSTAAHLSVASGNAQTMWSGRRSADPFRVRALGADGLALAGVRVRFALEGSASGVLSQPEAATDGEGYAETFLLDARSGEGAHVRAQRAHAERVRRTPPAPLGLRVSAGDR